MTYNKIEALRKNTAAIQTAWSVLSERRNATEQELEIVKEFSGFGGIDQVNHLADYLADSFDESRYNIDGGAELKVLTDTLRTIANNDEKNYNALVKSIKYSSLTAYYTPTPIINAVSGAVNNTLAVFGIKASSMLETSAGIGGFLPIAQAGCKTVAFEKDIVTSLILAVIHPDTDVHNAGFEKINEIIGNDVAFDLVASNFPFGNSMMIYDRNYDKGDDIHKSAQQSINAYFPMKSIEQLENGGILAFITSSFFADSKCYEPYRKWLCSMGNLLAAVRLPNDLFVDANGVGSDLVIFQRDIHKSWQTLDETFYCQTIQKNIGGQMINQVNRLLCLPKNVLYTEFAVKKNQYGDFKPTYRWKDGNDNMKHSLFVKLSSSMQRQFCKSAWLYGHDSLRKQFELRTKINEAQQHGSVIIDRENKKKSNAALLSQVKPYYATLMDAYHKLDEHERTFRTEGVELRAALNEAYDALTNRFGTIHSLDKVLMNQEGCLVALSLETRHQDGTYRKSDIFDHPIAFRVLKEGESFSPIEALVISLNERGKVDMEYMKSLTHISEARIYESLRGEIFAQMVENNRGEWTPQWQHKSRCINGNMYDKIAEIDRFVNTMGKASDIISEEYFNWYHIETRKALYEAIPEPVPFDLIDIQLGARWLPLSFFEDFGKSLFHCDSFKVGYYEATTDGFFIEEPFKKADGGRFGEWSVYGEESGRRFSGFDILRFAMNDKCPDVTYKIAEQTFIDRECMRLIQKKIDKMRREFARWIKNTTSNVEQSMLADTYNRMYNSEVRPSFDGSHQTFPGLSFANLPFDDLYQSQKNCIWMLIQNFGGVAWHNVGGGKTMIMCCAAMEMKRLGICNKPLIIGMKANVAQIADNFRKCYPSARMLFPGAGDFSNKNRVEFFNKIKNNDWDVVIMSHDQFGFIPQHAETEMYVLDEELADLRSTIDVLTHSDDQLSKRKINGLTKRIENLEAKREKLQNDINSHKDDVLDFHTMGFGHIFVDEYQVFKNLGFSTQHSRVRGVGNTEGSNRAYNLLVAIRDIQLSRGNGSLTDMGATFLSGTVVSNSLTELYSVFRYLRPVAMRKQKTRSFDAWAAQFAEKSCDYELDIAGQIKTNERFRKFINVPELSKFLHEITDYRDKTMIGLDTPKQINIQDFADPTEEQQQMLDRLIRYAGGESWECLGLPNSVKPNGIENAKVDPRMLIATDVARKTALDPRCLADDVFHDDPSCKASRCALNIATLYRKYNEQKATQFVFCDLSAPSKDKNRRVQWSIYDEVRRKLIEDYSIPASEIAFIHDNDAPTKKTALFDKLNEGTVRVVFGSTQKLGTGVNAQRRAVAVHHLDIPWKPADLEQREGRAVRTGNLVKEFADNEVKVYVYGTNKTLDAYKFNLLNAKAKFISQIALGTTTSRHLDEGAIESDDNGNERMDFAEYVALLSGNTDLLEMSKIDRKIDNLESDRAAFERSIRCSGKIVEDCKKRIQMLESNKERVDNDLVCIGKETISIVSKQQKTYRDWTNEQPVDGEKSVCPDNTLLVVPSAKDQSVEEQGRALMKIRKDYCSVVPSEVARWAGLPIMVRSEKSTTEATSNIFTIKLPSGLNFPTEGFSLGNSFASAVHCWDNVVSKLIGLSEYDKHEIASTNETIKAQQAMMSSSWDGEDELRELKAKRDELDARIKGKLDETQAEAEKKAKAKAMVNKAV